MKQLAKHGFIITNNRTSYNFHACVCGFGEPGTDWPSVDQHISDAAHEDFKAKLDFAESAARAATGWVPTDQLLPPEFECVLIVRTDGPFDVVMEVQYRRSARTWNLFNGNYLPLRAAIYWQFKPAPPPRNWRVS